MKAEQMFQWLFTNGMSASLVVKSGGTACACMTARDSNHPSYSPEWHANNPGSAACNGTGFTGTLTTTTTSIKAVIHPLSAVGNWQIAQKWLSEIGEIKPEDMYFIGAVNASTGAFVDISSNTNERLNKITFNAKDYVIRDVYPILFGTETICNAARLSRSA